VIAAAAVVIAAHGLIHLMGVALLWKLGEVGQLRYATAVPAPGSTAGYLAGGLWLVAAVLFVTAAALLAAGRAGWHLTALPGCGGFRGGDRADARPGGSGTDPQWVDPAPGRRQLAAHQEAAGDLATS